MRRFFIKFLLVLLAIGIAGFFVLFKTSFGYNTRVLLAQTLLSTMDHKNWAKYTFLPESEMKKLEDVIDNPNYINSHNKKLVKVDTSNDLIVTVDSIDKKYSDHYFKGKIMTVSNPHNIKLGVSKGTQNNSKYGEQLGVIAENEGAIAGINASGFVDPKGVGTGGIPIGIVIKDGVVINGKEAKENYTAGFTNNSKLITGFYSPDELLKLHVKDAAGFKPQLIVNGKKMITVGNGGWGYGPRTAIGQKADGSVLMIVIDGRQPHSLGASLKDVQDILFDYGAVEAMAMDGGSSAAMYLNGNYVTIPSSVAHVPRYLPDAWLVVPKKNQKVQLFIDGVETEVKQ
jgi:exopolysaccharide biosynthesis protein